MKMKPEFETVEDAESARTKAMAGGLALTAAAVLTAALTGGPVRAAAVVAAVFLGGATVAVAVADVEPVEPAAEPAAA